MSESFVRKTVRHVYAKIGKPYIWGGNGELMWTPDGVVRTIIRAHILEAYDCAGLIKDSTFDALGTDVRWLWNAQTMFDRLPVPDIGDQFALRFYGPGPASVSHVALDIGNGLIIEAAGGDQTTLTYTDAMRRGADVRLCFEHRKDFLGARSLEAMERVAL